MTATVPRPAGAVERHVARQPTADARGRLPARTAGVPADRGAFLFALLVYVVYTAAPGWTWTVRNMPSDLAAGDRRCAVGDHRDDLGDRLTALLPADRRSWRPSTSRSTRTRPVVEPADRNQHPEPRRRSVDRLRHPRPRPHRSRSATGPHRPRGGDHAVAAGPAGGDHLHSGGAPRGAALHPAGSLALGATNGRRSGGRCCPRPCPGSATGSILALSRAIGEAAPLLLLGAPHVHHVQPGRRARQYTVLPMQIYNLIKQSREEFRAVGIRGDRRPARDPAADELR